MLATFLRALTLADMRRKLLFTAALLAVFRLGSYLPAPGVNTDATDSLSGNFTNGSLGLLNLLSGGSIQRFSLLALGIMPFITASIVMQVLGAVNPKLAALRKEGETGQVRITQYTRYLTLALALAQSVGYVALFRSISNSAGVQALERTDLLSSATLVGCLTAGAIFTMWLGELITRKGIANGMSLLICAAILSRLPHGIEAWWHSPDAVFKVLMPFLALAVVVGVVYVNAGQRRIPVQYARRAVGHRMTGGAITYLPLRLNMAGVIPIIFAGSLMALPATLGQVIHTSWASSISNALAPQHWPFLVGEALLIFAFSYFYNAVTFNPAEQADELRSAGGYIPGVRPGLPTAQMLGRVLKRLTLPGAAYLAMLAALPTLLLMQTSANFVFGGTSVLIVVGVALEATRKMEAQLRTQNYERLLDA